MVNLQRLNAKGMGENELRAKFTSDRPSDKVQNLMNRVRARVQDGINNNFLNYKVYYAIDKAWDTPFRQVTATLIQALANQNYSDSVLKSAQDWGLTHLLTDEIDPKTEKPTGRKKFNVPTFFNIFVPLVRAYVLIRAAKLTADRDLIPHFRYEPLQNTALNRARCEVLTDRTETMTTQMGYRDIGRQSILKTLLYATQLQFVQEEWYAEEQENGDGSRYIVKEGLRYHLPHPTRSYIDIAHPPSSLNTDTGVEFLGHWRVRRYGDLRRNQKLWNRDRIAFDARDYRRDNATFFNSVYAACTLQWPQSAAAWAELDRENELSSRFYTSTFDDSAVLVSEHFERLIPSEDGLGDYDYPVWFRFVVAGDGTIMYAAPLPDVPAIWWGYDPDENRSMNASLALEVMPFQDQISNLLTQTILSVKQNLANLTFVDTDIVDEEGIQVIENAGEAQFRKLNFVRYSGRKARTGQQDVRYAFGSVRFPQLDTSSTLNIIGSILSILERVLVMSAQEIAGQASHEQSAEEVRHINRSVSLRANYTSMMIDRAYDAWKRQLYSYLMAYGEEEIYAQLSPQPEYTAEILEKLGFTVEHPPFGRGTKMQVKAFKTALQLEYFASTRDGKDRTDNTAMATAMVQALQVALSNQLMSQAIGSEQAVMLMNQVLETMGMPKDFKIQPLPVQMQPDEMQKWVQEQLLQVVEQVKQFVAQGQQQVLQEVATQLKPLAEELPKLAQATASALALSQNNQLAIAKITEVLSLDTARNGSPNGFGSETDPALAEPARMPAFP